MNLVVASLLAAIGVASWVDGSGSERRLVSWGGTLQAATRPGLPVAKSRAFGLPPPPEGVVDLPFADVFKPIGCGGLEYTDRVRALEGRRVRMVGFMVRQERGTPGTFLFAPVPTRLAESHYGLADDLPASTVHVSVSCMRFSMIPHVREPLVLVGTIGLGNREEPSGRISSVRLMVDQHLESVRADSRELLRGFSRSPTPPVPGDPISAAGVPPDTADAPAGRVVLP